MDGWPKIHSRSIPGPGWIDSSSFPSPKAQGSVTPSLQVHRSHPAIWGIFPVPEKDREGDRIREIPEKPPEICQSF